MVLVLLKLKESLLINSRKGKVLTSSKVRRFSASSTTKTQSNGGKQKIGGKQYKGLEMLTG